MSRRPELGYYDDGLDLRSPASYEGCVGEPGEAAFLPLAAYRSLDFAYLEDERIWTREWVCIGTAQDLPQVGDLLPYTLGHHGIHVRRQADGSLLGAFNQAQHGGCRVVPDQCQGGTKTRCSFTSCGYSRDRTPLQADELGEGSAAMHQYLGLRPERLLPVQVATCGALVWVNLDPDAQPLNNAAQHPLQAWLADSEHWARIGVSWREYDCNWKLLAPHLLGLDSHDYLTAHGPALLEGQSSDVDVAWCFPGLLLLRKADVMCVVMLQPVALGKTLCRVQLLSARPLLDAQDQTQLQVWIDWLDARGRNAVAQHQALLRQSHPETHQTPFTRYPRQNDRAGLWAQHCLIQRLTLHTQAHSELQLFSNVRNYLI
ncbi:MAG TPA: hypothetical protein VGC62_00010 [Pseudomonas sp.]|uniref:hypothetical protein n=1 Tax=Pseudomonas sp. TaxID=306 RepID=UPI002EDBB6AF